MDNNNLKQTSMTDLTSMMNAQGKDESQSFQIIPTINGEKLNERLNGIGERYNNTSPILDVIDNIGKENINKNGVPIYFISIDTNYKDDKIMGDPTKKKATGMFKNIKLISDSDSLPTFTNMKTSFDFQNYLNDFLMYAHKNDFKERSTEQIDSFKQYNSYWYNKTDYIPKPGDIVIIDNEYLVAFEITDIDDDSFLYFSKRDYWTIMLQHWTKQSIDYTLIQKEMTEVGLDFILSGYASNDTTISNSIIAANDHLDSDDRNISRNKKKGNTAFDKVFGQWD